MFNDSRAVKRWLHLRKIVSGRALLGSSYYQYLRPIISQGYFVTPPQLPAQGLEYEPLFPEKVRTAAESRES